MNAPLGQANRAIDCCSVGAVQKDTGYLMGGGRGHRALQVVSQPVELGNQEVDVLLSHRAVRDDVTEEVGSVVQGLVAHHESACLHHTALQDRRDLGNTLKLEACANKGPVIPGNQFWKSNHEKVIDHF